MKIIYIILGVASLAAVILFAWWWLSNSERLPPTDKNVKTAAASQPPRENPYVELRSMALNMPSDDFDVERTSKMPIPYGLVMDWHVGEGVITLTAFSSGDASMYTSTGGGMIGGIGHESVKDAARSLVKRSQEFVPKAQNSDEIQTPGADEVKFFILTNQGRFVAQENLQNFDNGSSVFLELFVEANKLITELRALDDAQK